MLLQYRNSGDAIIVSAPGMDDVIIHVFQAEYERREALMRAGYNHDRVEAMLARGIVMFHGPAAQEAQLAIIKRLAHTICPERDRAFEMLNNMILESEVAYHA